MGLTTTPESLCGMGGWAGSTVVGGTGPHPGRLGTRGGQLRRKHPTQGGMRLRVATEAGPQTSPSLLSPRSHVSPLCWEQASRRQGPDIQSGRRVVSALRTSGVFPSVPNGAPRALGVVSGGAAWQPPLLGSGSLPPWGQRSHHIPRPREQGQVPKAHALFRGQITDLFMALTKPAEVVMGVGRLGKAEQEESSGEPPGSAWAGLLRGSGRRAAGAAAAGAAPPEADGSPSRVPAERVSNTSCGGTRPVRPARTEQGPRPQDVGPSSLGAPLARHHRGGTAAASHQWGRLAQMGRPLGAWEDHAMPSGLRGRFPRWSCACLLSFLLGTRPRCAPVIALFGFTFCVNCTPCSLTGCQVGRGCESEPGAF